MGSQTNVPSWLDRADVGIQSSHWEGFGLTAVEMMASGLPVVATDVDGLKQVVEGAGLLFPAGDARALAAHVVRLMNDQTYYARLQTASLQRAALYDISETVKQYVDVYKNCLSEQ